jgi:spore coat protein U-like protein
MPAIRATRLLLIAGIAGPLLAAGAVEAQQAYLRVKARVVGECTLSGGTLDFGTYMSGQDSPRNGQTSVGVDCPRGFGFTIMMSGGNNPGPGNFRNMAGSGDLLRYQLYTDSGRTDVWSTGSGGKRINGSSGGNQSHAVFGHIPAHQVADAGNYTNTVVITLSIDG